MALPPGLRTGVLDGAERTFFGSAEVEALYDVAIGGAQALGATTVPFDDAPFARRRLLCDGPLVAERLAAVEGFNGPYRLNPIRQQVAPVWQSVDLQMLPTSPTIHTVADMLADPIAKNSQFGRHTNFANLMGLAAIAVAGGGIGRTAAQRFWQRPCLRCRRAGCPSPSSARI